jgi:prolyl-tRNA synthetase
MRSVPLQPSLELCNAYTHFEQFMTIQDRKKSGFILSPTHEEEITNLVSDMTNSYKDFPLQLYQICTFSSPSGRILHAYPNIST